MLASSRNEPHFLSVQCAVQYRRGGGEDPGTEGVDIRGPGRPGITIGGGGAGGGAEGSRFRARGGGGAAADQRNLADAMQVCHRALPTSLQTSASTTCREC